MTITSDRYSTRYSCRRPPESTLCERSDSETHYWQMSDTILPNPLEEQRIPDWFALFSLIPVCAQRINFINIPGPFLLLSGQ
jgi:hypothetical protein